MDPLDFLRAHAPFDRLDAAALRRVAATLEIAFAPAGAHVLQRGAAPARFLYVIRKGVVRLERDGEVVQVLEEGDTFGFPSLVGRTSPLVDAVVAEDALLYQVPEAEFRALVESPGFAEFFVVSLSERLHRHASLQPVPFGRALWGSLEGMPLAPVRWIAPGETVQAAARLMREAGASAIFVEGSPPGIVTDSDLRVRVLAEGRGPSTPVGEIATRPVATVPSGSTLLEALTFMLERRVHHAALESAGRLVGLITDADLLRLQVQTPLYLLRTVERLAVPGDLPRYGQDLAAMVGSLTWSGLDAWQVGPIVARVNDALVARLIAFVQSTLGPAPVPFAWIVFGSEGRREQTLLADQDHALTFSAGGEGVDAYFARLAREVVALLLEAGFPPCPGGYMATSWRMPVDDLAARFRAWILKPDPQGLVDALNLFDFRPVAGDLDVGPLDDIIAAAAREPRFLAHFARASLGLEPPLGAFRHIKEDHGGVDLKRGGLVPVAGLARLLALEAGARDRPTLARLEAAAAAGTLSHEGAATLAQAFRFLMRLRLTDQLRHLRAGRPLSTLTPLDALTSLDRAYLKDVFVAIREVQQATALRYAIDRLA